MQTTVQQNTARVAAAVAIVAAVAELIRDVGQIPSGQLYALVMDKFSLETYERIIQQLINTGLVRREPSHMLVWIGPGGAR
jgi:hypothetical protein